ncbi:hypothetical protein [Actinacidiphila sp. ITFR-21]|uniref:hypothetical protein n=1 Tax=Actinacidiphila sp. ITFR-21 TaxID=3075199 RepID=UPI00288C4782|nr:hypothetical protein [Streptomyces sp. ITFR-21]WNI20059.1 hypothetical protein RLT57_31465 [Streptomyces sp. ITFR-21]
MVGVERCTFGPTIDGIDGFVNGLFAQVRSDVRLSYRRLDSHLTPECTIHVEQTAFQDREEARLHPPLPRLSRLPGFHRIRAVHAPQAPAIRAVIAALYVCRRLVRHDPQSPRETSVRGGHRGHHHLHPYARQAPARHVEQPLPNQTVHHPGRLRQRAPQQPRDRRIRTIEPSSHRSAHQPHAAIRPRRQHQPQQPEPLSRRPPAATRREQARRRLRLTHRRPPRTENGLAQRQQYREIPLLQRQRVDTPRLSSRQRQQLPGQTGHTAHPFDRFRHYIGSYRTIHAQGGKGAVVDPGFGHAKPSSQLNSRQFELRPTCWRFRQQDYRSEGDRGRLRPEGPV